MNDTQRLANPLALAVLVLLYERPMHPYQMASTLKDRKKEASIKLNYGSLYTVIEQLLQKKFISPRETLRAGRRPPKTIYQLTPAGERELTDWLRELLSAPVKEFPRFEAALSLIPALPPEEAAGLLEIRAGLLAKTVKEIDDSLRACADMKLPRLFSLETEYDRAATIAERKFCADLAADINADTGGLRSEWTRLRKTLSIERAKTISRKKPSPKKPQP
jgi:DNA-binding PadR family transcriptional regulator